MDARNSLIRLFLGIDDATPAMKSRRRIRFNIDTASHGSVRKSPAWRGFFVVRKRARNT
jgi:hypothetical protein